MRAWHLGSCWCVAALLLACALTGAHAAPVSVLEWRDALWMPARSDGGPDAAAGEPVRLPHDLRPLEERGNPSWYRIDFRLDAVPDVPQVVYFPGVYAHLELELNGNPLAATGARDERPQRGWRLTRLFEIPRDYLRTGNNTLLIRAGGIRAWTFAAPSFGPRTTLHPVYVKRLLGTAVAPLTVGAMVALLGIFVTALWIHRRAESLYGYFGVASLLWGLHTIWALTPYTLLPQPHDRILWTATYTFWVSLLVIFFVRYTGKPWRRFIRAMWIYAIAGFPLLYLAEAFDAFPPASAFWRAVVILCVFAGLFIVIRFAWRERRVDSILLMLTGAISAAFAVRDFVVAQAPDTLNPVWLVPYAGVAYMVLFGWLLVGRFHRNADSLEHVNETLTERVAVKTRELADNYERLRAAERQQSTLEERSRILRDMHDGLGAKLMISLRSLERGQIDNQAAAALVRDCIDELRLTVDAYDQTDGDLAGLLANLRYRLGDRLQAAGLEVEWRVAETPPIPALEKGGRELMRIIQEALNNILKHAGATKVVFETAVEADYVRVSLRDNGRGFTAPADPALTDPTPGHGLANMRLRAEQLGATLRILGASGVASGTEIQLRLPFAQEAAADHVAPR